MKEPREIRITEAHVVGLVAVLIYIAITVAWKVLR